MWNGKTCFVEFALLVFLADRQVIKRNQKEGANSKKSERPYQFLAESGPLSRYVDRRSAPPQPA